jgi:murein DD-endopeptidase MepM/ murein hydrolase activator NlpD
MVRRFQAARGLTADGRAGPGTLRALRHGAPRRTNTGSSSSGSGTPSGAVRFLRPVNAPMGDGFGYPPGRGGRRHDGIDFPARMGTPVGAAGVGTVVSGRWDSGGYGNLLIIQHRLGYQTWYAHLSGYAVRAGQRVSGGTKVAYVGTTGHSTGPHLHFEVRHNGVPVDPAPMLLQRSSLGKRSAGPFAAPPHTCGPGASPSC